MVDRGRKVGQEKWKKLVVAHLKRIDRIAEQFKTQQGVHSTCMRDVRSMGMTVKQRKYDAKVEHTRFMEIRLPRRPKFDLTGKEIEGDITQRLSKFQ